MEKNGRKEFCEVCKTTTMLRGRSISPVSSLALWVFLILGLILISQLKTDPILCTFEPPVRAIYIAAIIIFAAYDSFIKTLDYRCNLCGVEESVPKAKSNRFFQLFIDTSTIFFAFVLIALAIILVFIFLTV